MVEFNADGSLKLPSCMAKDKEETKRKLKSTKCIMIKQEVVNFTAPKKCVLHLQLSEALADNRFVFAIHQEFGDKASVPTKLIKINEKEFDIEIGTDFKRCSDCTNLIRKYKEFLYDNAIVKKGNCTYEGQGNKEFCYEDFFE
ncbi:MAG: hypothetical protein V1702_05810 [Candidatus Woesearchaeota archaeon]